MVCTLFWSMRRGVWALRSEDGLTITFGTLSAVLRRVGPLDSIRVWGPK